MAVALAFVAAALAVAGVWELLAAVERTRVAAALAHAVAPLVRAGTRGREPDDDGAAAARGARGGRARRGRVVASAASRSRSSPRVSGPVLADRARHGAAASVPGRARRERARRRAGARGCAVRRALGPRRARHGRRIPGPAGHELAKAGRALALGARHAGGARTPAPQGGLAGVGRDRGRHPAPARRRRRPAGPAPRPRGDARDRHPPGARRDRRHRSGALHGADRARAAARRRAARGAGQARACSRALLTNPVSLLLTTFALTFQLVALVTMARITRNVDRVTRRASRSSPRALGDRRRSRTCRAAPPHARRRVTGLIARLGARDQPERHARASRAASRPPASTGPRTRSSRCRRASRSSPTLRRAPARHRRARPARPRAPARRARRRLRRSRARPADDAPTTGAARSKPSCPTCSTCCAWRSPPGSRRAARSPRSAAAIPGTLARELTRFAARTELGEPVDHALDHLEAALPVPQHPTVRRRAPPRRAPRRPTCTHARRPGAPRRAPTAPPSRAEQAAKAAPKIQLVVALLLVPAVLLLIAAALVPVTRHLSPRFLPLRPTGCPTTAPQSANPRADRARCTQLVQILARI